MVLLGRIELPTSPLPRVRSTTELQQRRGRSEWRRPEQARAIVAPAHNVKQRLSVSAALPLRYLSARRFKAKAFRMSEQPRNNLTREERLAAQLRENLRRRKAQARQMNAASSGPPGESAAQTLSKPAEGS